MKANNVEEYVPSAFKATNLQVGQPSDLIRPVSQTTVVRRVKLLNIKGKAGRLYKLEFDDVPSAVPVNPKSVMEFGGESVTIEEYIWRAVEKNDLLDLILEPNKSPQATHLWVHIDYLEERPDDSDFSEKDAGLFGMRTKAGEKAERLVARELVATYGHRYPSSRLEGAGVFQITYTGKKKRKPDLVCTACQLHVEAKKRNRDRRYRISHSDGRPFQRENKPDGWHAFVFPDRTIHYVPNKAIITLLRQGYYTAGRDRHDAWADLDSNKVQEVPPPHCNSKLL